MTVPELIFNVLAMGSPDWLVSGLGAMTTPAGPEFGWVGEWIGAYGPWAMIALLLASGFGIPIGEEVVNIPAGIFVGREQMAVVPAYLAAYFGVLGGDFLWFSICRFLGKSLLHRKWFKRFVHPRRLLQVKHQFDRRGAGVLVVARFIPGTRTPALTVAGIMHMPWKRFTIIEIILCSLTTTLQVTLGILIGRQIASASLKTTILTALGTVAGILAVTAIITWLVNARRRKEVKPRERVAWLKKFGRGKITTDNKEAASDPV